MSNTENKRPVTGATITDEQIRALALSANAEERAAANRALHGRSARARLAARVRCAKLIAAARFDILVEQTRNHGAMCPCASCKEVRRG